MAGSKTGERDETIPKMSSGRVRPFLEEDISWVADLYTRVFLGIDRSASPELGSYFQEVFFRNPWCQEDIPSLVYQEGNGKNIGFLGVLPRRMRLKSQPLQVAISFHFMVEPESRSTLAGVQLLKALFAGPQDLSLTDGAGMLGRKVWEGLGGETALLYSLYWTRVLRPGQFVLSLIKKRRLSAPLAFATAPLWSITDRLATRVKPMHFAQPPQVVEGELDPGTFLAGLDEFAGLQSVRPEYDERTLDWLLQRAARRRGFGRFQKVIVRSDSGKPAGWYLYYVNPGGTSEVLQFVAKKDRVQLILDHLFFHAWRHGAAAVAGRLDPRFVQELSDNYCIFHRRGPWMLVQAKRSEFLEPIYRGDAFLTRLEGEWCVLYDNA